ncbi:MAG: hypothetical protein LUG54_04595 [Clostridiales bacterium]|nr:hypothetical protein [Clostridiales bacterium]
MVIRMKEYIREHVNHLAVCEICVEEPQTIFIVELPCESYEEKGNAELTLLSIFDNEAYHKIGADFSLGSGEEIERRYTNRILEDNHRKLIALEREEYAARV